MDFTITISVANGTVDNMKISDNPQLVSIGAVLQALDAARAAFLNVPIAQPQPPAA